MPGIIEAFYGPLWPDEDRRTVIDTLARPGFSFYHYAPKADPQVRKDWRNNWSEDRATALSRLRDHCHARGMAFGLGLSPVGLQQSFSDGDRRALRTRLQQINGIAPDHLLILFDDERGDVSDLAHRQARILEFVGEHTHSKRVYCCPTYFSDDPMLDDLFGPRPDHYLEDLGKRLDPAIRIYWTGPKICSGGISSHHLNVLEAKLRRKPSLWDNYPVNDSPEMIGHLHLRAFEHRGPELTHLVQEHACNPALQAHLGLIPLLTLTPLNQVGKDRNAKQAFREAAERVVGADMAACLEADLPLLEDRGRTRLSDPERAGLRDRYQQFDHPAAREILRWLKGGYENLKPFAPGIDESD